MRWRTQTMAFSPSQQSRRVRFLSTAQTPPSERGPETPLYGDNKQHLLTSSLLLCIRCKDCTGIAAKQHVISMHAVYRKSKCLTYSEGRSRDIQPCWVLSQGTCDSSWNQIPFYRWTRSWEWKINTIFRHKRAGLQQHRVVVWWWYFL